MNPWLDLPNDAPFVIPQDLGSVEDHNSRAADIHRFKTDCLPEPFLGAREARVVFLNLNPGYAPGVEATHADPAFAAAHRATLRHERSDYPMYLLHPQFASTGGGVWWRKRLRVLAEAAGGYEVLGSRMLVLEAIAYPSIKFKQPRLPLRSTDYVADLLREAMANERPVVAMRARKIWGKLVPELTTYPSLYTYNSALSVYCTPRNCPEGFDHIVSAITA